MSNIKEKVNKTDILLKDKRQKYYKRYFNFIYSTNVK